MKWNEKNYSTTNDVCLLLLHLERLLSFFRDFFFIHPKWGGRLFFVILYLTTIILLTITMVVCVCVCPSSLLINKNDDSCWWWRWRLQSFYSLCVIIIIMLLFGHVDYLILFFFFISFHRITLLFSIHIRAKKTWLYISTPHRIERVREICLYFMDSIHL